MTDAPLAALAHWTAVLVNAATVWHDVDVEVHSADGTHAVELLPAPHAWLSHAT